jgi:serine/threonine-protein kinase RsbW
MMPTATQGDHLPVSDRPQDFPAKLSIASDPSEARCIQEAIECALKEHQYCEKDIFSVRLAVEEALINAIKHGNQMDRNKKVHVSFQVRAEHIEIVVDDEGPGFDPNDVPDPTAPENLERCCGRGLMLMRHYMTEVAYNRRGNSVRMSKQRNGAKS